jgi:hypothetical protein
LGSIIVRNLGEKGKGIFWDQLIEKGLNFSCRGIVILKILDRTYKFFLDFNIGFLYLCKKGERSIWVK